MSNTLPHANEFARNPLAAGPAPAQAAPDLSGTLESIPDKLKEFGNTLEDKARAAIEHIKDPVRTFQGTGGWCVCVCVRARPCVKALADSSTLTQWGNCTRVFDTFPEVIELYLKSLNWMSKCS